jgi:hypothetical protein
MVRNPYSPPAAVVADPAEAQHQYPQPKQVRVAVILLWASFALGFPAVYLEYQHVTSAAEAVVLTIIMVAACAFAALLNVKIARGRNWSRWAFLVMMFLTLLSYLAPDDATRVVSWAEGALSVTSSVLDAVALYLLFSWPGALWFRPPA